MAKISKAQFVTLQKKLLRDSYIASELGISRQAVYQTRVKYGLKSMTPNFSARNAAIAKAYKGGKTGTAVAQKFELSASQVYRIINATLYHSVAKPASTKKIVSAKKDVSMKKNVSTKKIVTTKKNAAAKKIVSAKKDVSTKKIVATKKIAATKKK